MFVDVRAPLSLRLISQSSALSPVTATISNYAVLELQVALSYSSKGTLLLRYSIVKKMQRCELYFKQVLANWRSLQALNDPFFVRDYEKMIAFINTNSRRLGSWREGGKRAKTPLLTDM